MFRILLSLLRPLKTIANELARIADALDRAHPKRTSTVVGAYVPYDEDEHDIEVERREVFERRAGRPLNDNEELPGGFDHEDRLAAIRKWFGTNEHKPD